MSRYEKWSIRHRKVNVHAQLPLYAVQCLQWIFRHVDYNNAGMNHSALFSKLMDRQLPNEILRILELWLYISVTCVKWNGYNSHFFRLLAGVHQGGFLSPFLFAVLYRQRR